MTASPLTPLEASITSLITRAAGAQPTATVVWLFGSRARGASTEDSDLDIAVEFSAPETAALRAWIERIRREAEAPIADQWPGFVNLIGLYAEGVDQRLARRIRAEGIAVWRRTAATAGTTAAVAGPSINPARP
jgi:predicted nucleotidyltransferase